MYSILLLIILWINISLLFAMPSAFLYEDDNDFEGNHLVKRFQFSPWIHKRNPALCDYRLQLRPLPLTSALCTYGKKRRFLIQFVDILYMIFKANQTRGQSTLESISIWLICIDPLLYFE